MAKARTYDEKVRDLEKRVKGLEAENAELKRQIEKLKPKSVHYKEPVMKEHYSTAKVKKDKKEDAIPEIHEESEGKA